jgi:hypothetical protein
MKYTFAARLWPAHQIVAATDLLPARAFDAPRPAANQQHPTKGSVSTWIGMRDRTNIPLHSKRTCTHGSAWATERVGSGAATEPERERDEAVATVGRDETVFDKRVELDADDTGAVCDEADVVPAECEIGAATADRTTGMEVPSRRTNSIACGMVGKCNTAADAGTVCVSPPPSVRCGAATAVGGELKPTTRRVAAVASTPREAISSTACGKCVAKCRAAASPSCPASPHVNRTPPLTPLTQPVASPLLWPRALLASTSCESVPRAGNTGVLEAAGLPEDAVANGRARVSFWGDPEEEQD